MQIKQATWNDESQLTEFFESFAFEDLINFKIQRPQGFFHPYQIQGKDFETYFLASDEGAIVATSSFVYHDFYSPSHDRPLKLAIARDMRLLPTRKAAIGWHENLNAIITQVKSAHDTNGLMVLLSKKESHLLNSFLRTRLSSPQILRYDLYQRVKLVSLHGFFPIYKVDLPWINVRPAQESDISMIDQFIKDPLHHRYSDIKDAHSLQTQLKNMGLELDSVWLAINSQLKIVGLLTLLPSDLLQNYIPLSYQLRAHNFRQFLKFGSLLGWTHRLTKPKSRSKSELALNFFHVGHIRVTHSDVFEWMLKSIYNQIDHDSFLIYLKEENDQKLTLGPSALTAEMDFGLYSITQPNESFLTQANQWNREKLTLDSFYHF